jgi:hypothetical protein
MEKEQQCLTSIRCAQNISVMSPENSETIMVIPKDAPSELLIKAKESKSFDDLILYLEKLERAIAMIASSGYR